LDAPRVRAPPVAGKAGSSRKLAALAIAAGADVVQVAVAPLFGEGFASPFNDALDVAVAVALVWLLGFHWALLPAVAAEMVPALDLAPTWTASVLFIAAPSKARLWVAIGAVALIAVAAYAAWRLAHGR
jgi:hypothetical protein